MEKISWSAFEYEDKDRSTDWFWALGVIVVTSSIASVIYGDYFFAVLILFGGGMLGFFAVRKPELINYELNDKGLTIKHKIFQYNMIKSFWVQREDSAKELAPTLFIKSSRLFMPIISIPIHNEITDAIHNLLTSQNIKEEKMHEHPSLKIMEILGF